MRGGADFRRERIAAARDRLDVGPAARLHAQRLSQREDVLGQVGLFDEHLRPEGPHQLRLGKDPPRLLHEEQEEVEGLGRYRHGLASTLEPAPVEVDPEGAELQELFVRQRLPLP